MKCFTKTAGVILVLAVIFVFGGTALADYQFDDISGPSGKGYQWMIINDAGDTFGDSYGVPIDVSGDIINNEDVILDVLNGKSNSDITDKSLNTFFLVVQDGYGEFTMNFRSPTMRFEAVTPNLELSTPYNENSTPYIDTKDALGRPDGYDPTWAQYKFVLARQNSFSSQQYDTVMQYFAFQQDPTDTASQRVPKPMVIANVSTTTAMETPLELRATLRDSMTNGNIVAYDHVTFPMTETPATRESGHWVFVPVDDLNIGNSVINYHLTTEVTNHTPFRYGAIPYDNYSTVYPDYWKFDLPRLQGTTNIPSSFLLARNSHIAPGLTAGFRRNFDVNEYNKAPVHFQPIGETSGTGEYIFRLNHRPIYGKRLGETYKYAAQRGNFSLFEITAYQPRPLTLDFYNKVASVMRSNVTVAPPTSSIFSSSSVKRDTLTSIPGAALEYFMIDQNIPGTLRNSTTEGILPLHITINIPVTRIQDRTWYNAMLEEWRRSGRIEETFADNLHIYLLAQDDGTGNPWDFSQELMDQGLYNDQVKVFFDQERGRSTMDNDRGVITVSFIVMLMNGTRDGVRPALQRVSDYTETQENDYAVIRDGANDNKWNMTFFVAPAGYFNNPAAIPVSEDTKATDTGSSGGGGCDAGIFGVIGLCACVFVLMRREGR